MAKSLDDKTPQGKNPKQQSFLPDTKSEPVETAPEPSKVVSNLTKRIEAEKKAKLAKYPASSDALLDAFCNYHRDDFCFRNEKGEWWMYDEGVWRTARKEAYQAARNTGKRTYLYMNTKNDIDERTANRLLSHNLWMSILSSASHPLEAEPESFDQDPNSLGLPEGKIQYLRTGHDPAPATPADRLTKRVACLREKITPPTLWLRHLDEIFKPRYGDDTQTIIDYLQVWLGYALTGHCTDETFLFLQGEPGSGKSTFLDPILNLFGDYARVISADTLTSGDQRQHRERLARLEGARLVAASEIKGNRWDVSDLNALVSGEPITANHMHKGSFTFTPQAKVILLGNERPRASEGSGLWRRMILLEFPVSLPKNQQDPNRKRDLLLELPSIFNWMLEGTAKWYQSGMPSQPKILIEGRDRYKEEQNPLGAFIDECYIPQKGEDQKLSEAHSVYVQWCKDNRIVKPLRIEHVRPHYERKGLLMQTKQRAWNIIDGYVFYQNAINARFEK